MFFDKKGVFVCVFCFVYGFLVVFVCKSGLVSLKYCGYCVDDVVVLTECEFKKCWSVDECVVCGYLEQCLWGVVVFNLVCVGCECVECLVDGCLNWEFCVGVRSDVLCCCDVSVDEVVFCWVLCVYDGCLIWLVVFCDGQCDECGNCLQCGFDDCFVCSFGDWDVCFVCLYDCDVCLVCLFDCDVCLVCGIDDCFVL